jgi:hypothetical protein
MRGTLAVLAATLMCCATDSQAQVRIARPAVNQRALTEERLVSRMTVDETAAEATGLSRADLTIKEMCIAKDSTGAETELRALIANEGSANAPSFPVGINYRWADGSERMAIDTTNALAAGQTRWVTFQHWCCGWSPAPMVPSASGFEVIADPKYYRRNPLDPSPFHSYEVRPVVPESNERNNAMTVNKPAQTCGMAVQRPATIRVAPIRLPARP